MTMINTSPHGYQLREVAPNFTANSSTAVGQYLQEHIGRQLQEHFVVLSLNAALEVISLDTIAIGQITGVNVMPREVFQIALLNNAASIIITHNHPSGHVLPSQTDNKFTQRLKKLSDMMHLPLRDHFIVSGKCYYSYAENEQL